MEEIIVSYEWPSFVDHQISIRQLRTALHWLDLFVQIVDPSVFVYIEPFAEWSFKFKFLTKKDGRDIMVQSVAWGISGLFVSFVTFYAFTWWEKYTVDLSNSQIMWNVSVVNIDWGTQFFSKDLLPFVQNLELKKATQKIISPLSVSDDKFVFSDSESDIMCTIDYSGKESFNKEYIQEHSEFIVRGRIYEINFKQKSFKVESSLWYSFNVNLSDDLKIESVYPWVNTNSLELIGKVKMDLDGKIINMTLDSFEIIAPRLIDTNESQSGSI